MSPRTFARAVLRWRKSTIAAALILTVLALVPASRVRMESSIEIWFLEDDPSIVAYRDFLDRFDADEIAVLGVFADDVFAPEVIAAVRELTEASREAPYAHRVISLATVDVFEPSAGGVEIVPFLPEGPADPEVLRERAREGDWVVGALVSEDGRGTAVLVEMDPAGNSFDGKTAMVEALREAVARVARPGLDVRLSGTPVFDEAFFRYAERDMRLFSPVAALVVTGIVAFLFRRATAVLVPFTVVAFALVWIHGWMGLLGIDVNLVSTMLGALILAIGVADSIHVVAEFDRHVARGKTRLEAAEEATTRLFAPCFFTSATTAVGLLSLLASDLRPVSEFGWLAAIGVGFAFVLSMTLAPAILAMAPAPSTTHLARQDRGPLARLLDRLGRMTPVQSRGVAGVSAAIVALVVGGLFRLHVGANPIAYFKASDPVRRDVTYIDEHLGGGTSMEFLIEAPGDGLLDPELLRRVDALGESVLGRPAVGRTVSVVDALRGMDRALRPDAVDRGTIPGSRDRVAQYYLLMEGEEDFGAFVREGYSAGRLHARVRFTSSGEGITHLDDLQAELERDFSSPGFHVEATGFLKLIGEMENYLVASQIRSFSIAFTMITLMMVLLLRSLRLGLFSMIPNLAPIATGLGVMGWVGIWLDPCTVMIASIALGLVVDDTVHFLHRLRLLLLEGRTLETAIHGTMTEAGRPIVATSIVLAAGYGVLGFGSFNPNVYFGIVTASVILLALVADLVVLPAMLLVVRPRVAAPASVREALPGASTGG